MVTSNVLLPYKLPCAPGPPSPLTQPYPHPPLTRAILEPKSCSISVTGNE